MARHVPTPSIFTLILIVKSITKPSFVKTGDMLTCLWDKTASTAKYPNIANLYHTNRPVSLESRWCPLRCQMHYG
jgi:hypothetical protein